MILPQGTIPRGPAFFDPELKGRWGAARWRRRRTVPVIPIGLWGTERCGPGPERLPRVWNVTSPPTSRSGSASRSSSSYRSAQADTRRIMAAIVDLLPPGEARPRADRRGARAPTRPVTTRRRCGPEAPAGPARSSRLSRARGDGPTGPAPASWPPGGQVGPGHHPSAGWPGPAR